MRVRIRLAELLAERATTPYLVAKASGGRIGVRTMYRLAERNGRLKSFDSDVVDALCDVLGVTPGELFER